MSPQAVKIYTNYTSKITTLLLESYTSDTLLGHVPTCLSNDLLCAVLLRMTVIHQELENLQ